MTGRAVQGLRILAGDASASCVPNVSAREERAPGDVDREGRDVDGPLRAADGDAWHAVIVDLPVRTPLCQPDELSVEVDAATRTVGVDVTAERTQP